MCSSFMEILSFSGKVQVFIIHPLIRFLNFLREQWSKFLPQNSIVFQIQSIVFASYKLNLPAICNLHRYSFCFSEILLNFQVEGRLETPQPPSLDKMGGDGPAPGAHYSPAMGLIYIFNLIVGTGALTLPAAFHDAGTPMDQLFIKDSLYGGRGPPTQPWQQLQLSLRTNRELKVFRLQTVRYGEKFCLASWACTEKRSLCQILPKSYCKVIAYPWVHPLYPLSSAHLSCTVLYQLRLKCQIKNLLSCNSWIQENFSRYLMMIFIVFFLSVADPFYGCLLPSVLFEGTFTSFVKDKSKKEVTKQQDFLLDGRRILIRIQEAQKHTVRIRTRIRDTAFYDSKFLRICYRLDPLHSDPCPSRLHVLPHRNFCHRSDSIIFFCLIGQISSK